MNNDPTTTTTNVLTSLNYNNNKNDGIFRVTDDIEEEEEEEEFDIDDDENDNINNSNEEEEVLQSSTIITDTTNHNTLFGNNSNNNIRRHQHELYLQTRTNDDDDEENNSSVIINNNKSNSISSARICIGLGVLLLLLLMIVTFTSNDNIKLITPTRSNNSNNAHTTSTKSIDDESCKNNNYYYYQKQYQLDNIPNGAIASDHDICSNMGKQILQEQHGNAIDAAITVAICLGVVNPSSSGIGGGAFMLIQTNNNNDNDNTNINNNNIPDYIDARDKNTTINNNNNVEVIDCREMAPSKASINMYDNLPNNASVYGGLAIPIFGELKCLELAHTRHGKLSWKTVIQPIIDYYEQNDGIIIGTFLANEIQSTTIKMLKLQNYNLNITQYNTLRTIITKNNWEYPLQQGDIMKNNALIETIKHIADYGVDYIYNTMAETITNEIQQLYNGIIIKDDIINYKATIRTPVISTNILNTFNIIGVPPPSSGGATILAAIRFISGFISTLTTFHDTLTKHQIIEGCKHAFAIRMSLSDPNYNTDIVQNAIYDMTINDTYMNTLRQYYYYNNSTLPLSHYGGEKWAQLNDNDYNTNNDNITDAKEGDRHQRHHQQRQRRRRQHQKQQQQQHRELLRPFGYLNDHGTSHFSVIDMKSNTAVAMTTSVNTVFGSRIVSPSTGILFSNTMDDFAKPGTANYFGLRPSVYNYIQPGKRPLSSMSPTMVFLSNDYNGDNGTTSSLSSSLGKLMVVIGASGGPKIITAVLQVLINHIVFGRPLLDSITQARIHEQLIYHGAAVTATENAKPVDENGPDIVLSQRTKDALIKRGHQLVDVDYTGTVQAIAVDFETNTLTAACDPRKGGTPAGY